MAASLGGRRKERLQDLPFRIGQVAGIVQVVAIMAESSFRGPHQVALIEVNFLDSLYDSSFKVLPAGSRDSSEAATSLTQAHKGTGPTDTMGRREQRGCRKGGLEANGALTYK